MYADRYQPKKVNRSSLTASVGIVGGLLTVALLSSTYVAHEKRDKTIDTYWVKPAPPPPPVDQPPPPKQQVKQTPRIDQPTTIVPIDRPADVYVAPPEPEPTPTAPGTGEGMGTAVIPFDPPKPLPPVLTGVQVDPRYARDFQPLYPAAERRAGNEGVVTLKVLVGVDGRVRQVEKIAAASDEFWRVTERQALGRWRFRPATRDGIPVEGWRTMTVRFRLNGEE